MENHILELDLFEVSLTTLMCSSLCISVLQIIYGLDFTIDKREEQLEAVRSAIMEHARQV